MIQVRRRLTGKSLGLFHVSMLRTRLMFRAPTMCGKALMIAKQQLLSSATLCRTGSNGAVNTVSSPSSEQKFVIVSVSADSICNLTSRQQSSSSWSSGLHKTSLYCVCIACRGETPVVHLFQVQCTVCTCSKVSCARWALQCVVLYRIYGRHNPKLGQSNTWGFGVPTWQNAMPVTVTQRCKPAAGHMTFQLE